MVQAPISGHVRGVNQAGLKQEIDDRDDLNRTEWTRGRRVQVREANA
jgi:hypothetical protein